MKRVAIHYLRPPDHRTTYDQVILEEGPEGIVSFQPGTTLTRPVHVGDQVVLEDGSPVVWFTFPGLWHDIGLFHLADGTFSGLYANILTPVEIEDPKGSPAGDASSPYVPAPATATDRGDAPERSTDRNAIDTTESVNHAGVPSAADVVWWTTDLFLDVFRHPDGRVEILDQDELKAAVSIGAVDEVLAARARQEAATLVRAEAAGSWPPAIAGEWDLARARKAMARGDLSGY